MKKIYIKPDAEIVKVHLKGSVLGDPGLHDKSIIAGGEMDAKENNLLFEDEGDFGDIWDDGGDNANNYDLWNE